MQNKPNTSSKSILRRPQSPIRQSPPPVLATPSITNMAPNPKTIYSEGQAVQLIITAATDLGFKAIINDLDEGLLYADEVFQPLHRGQRSQGFIKKIREDGKIDLVLAETGHKAAQGIGEKIIKLLNTKGGFLPINDKTPAEEIYDLFGVSKKKYKIALGALYKQRIITVAPDGIRKK